MTANNHNEPKTDSLFWASQWVPNYVPKILGFFQERRPGTYTIPDNIDDEQATIALSKMMYEIGTMFRTADPERIFTILGPAMNDKYDWPKC